MATIIKRGNYYSVVLSNGIDPKTGRRRRDWHSGYPTRAAAKQAAAELTSRLNSGSYVRPTRTPLGEFLARTWLPTVADTVRTRTFASYSHNVRKHVIPHLGDVALQELSGPDLNRLYAHLRREGRVDGKGGLEPKTVRYIHTILHCALRAAVRWGLVARNTAAAADPPRVTTLFVLDIPGPTRDLVR